ncbi:MAG: LCP family protein [Firmicutes bacterium]|nr:LCP family protein [Alicyclobacillaceae bacterium]MCL6496283.1 LCP family protein [Bacillota bacterium]
MRRRARWGRIVGLCLGVLVMALGLGGFVLYRSAKAALSAVAAHNPPPFQHTITVLLLGEGLVENGATDIVNPVNVPDQTDTMMLVALNLRTGQAGVVSIPRDSRIDLPQAGGIAKINDANFVGGPALAQAVVEKTLGVPVDFYAEITMAHFAQVINAIGGLDVYVPYAMNYGTATGPYSYLNIHLQPGTHHLNGYQVLEFVRFRNEALGDIGRIQQQQYVLRLILQKLMTPAELSQWPRVIGLIRQDVRTDLSRQDLFALALLARKVHLSQVRYATLPGSPWTQGGISYWVLDQRLLPVVEHDTLIGGLTPEDLHRLRAEVASGTESLAPATSVVDWLQSQGVTVGPALWANQHHATRTIIANYTGDQYLADRLEQALGGPGSVTVENIPYHDVPGVDLVITVGSALHLNPSARL